MQYFFIQQEDANLDKAAEILKQLKEDIEAGKV